MLPTIECSFCRSLCSPRPLRGEVLADDRHAEVGALLAAVLLRERVAVVPGLVGDAAAPRRSSCLPLLVRQPAALPVGARVLAAVVEEADVVVLLLERLDLALDEVVELGEVVDRSSGSSKSTGVVPPGRAAPCGRPRRQLSVRSVPVRHRGRHGGRHGGRRRPRRRRSARTCQHGRSMRRLAPLRDFLRTEAAGGALLAAGTVAALAWANSPWSGAYRSLWESEGRSRWRGTRCPWTCATGSTTG